MSGETLKLRAAGIYDENHCYVMDEEGELRIFRSMVHHLRLPAIRRQIKRLRPYVRRVRYDADCIMTCVRQGVFRNFKNLESVTLCESINCIGYTGFMDCINLKEINTGKIVKFGAAAFKGCRNMADVDLKSAREIGASCFECCSALTDVMIPDQVRVIGEYAYKDCSGLKSVKANGVVRFGDGCFQHDYQLCDFVFPAKVRRIGPYAFEGTALTEAVMENTRRIGGHAFAECLQLKEVRFTGEALPSCAFTAFHGVTVHGICKEEAYHDAKMWSLRPAAGLPMEFSDHPEIHEERCEDHVDFNEEDQ